MSQVDTMMLHILV